MCLKTITEGPNPQEQGEGYKVFQYADDNGNTLVGSFTLFHRITGKRFTPSFQSDKWLSDPNNYEIEIKDDDEFYETGYHFFEKKEDAELIARSYGGTVRKVRYKNRSAKGTQCFNVFRHREESETDCYRWDQFPCIVAREIFIEKE
jgi:hypothetical protein